MRKYLSRAVAVLIVLAGAAGAYELPRYPQDAGAVSSISARLPGQAPAGGTVDLRVELRLDRPIAESRNVYLYLIESGKCRHVEVLKPKVASSKWPVGRPIELGPFPVSVPADLPGGQYEFRLGVYRENAAASGRIRIVQSKAGRGRRGSPLIITTGCYTDKYGTPHYWHINKAHTLIWDGEPFIPAGGMFIYDRDWNLVKAQLDLLARYGVRNIYLHLGVNQPYPWKDYSEDDYRFFQQTIDYLDEKGFTYGIEFEALEAKGPGYSYPGGGAGVDHVKTSGTVRAEAKGATSAVFIVADNPTGKVVQTGVARVNGDFVEADVKVAHEGDYRVAFAVDRPGPDGYVMYYWDQKYVDYVKKVRDHYSKVRLGPGFRFLVDPLWNEMNTNHSFIPSAPAFAKQFADWLAERYGSVEKLNEAWKPVGSAFTSFDEAGSTISIERIDDKTTRKLMQYCYSRETGRFHTMQACASQFNYDMREILGRSLLHYCNDIADVFRKMNDVPVIYKAFSDVDWWHINDTGLASGHDGLGMESYGNGEPMLLFMGAHIFGECEQATKTTWLIVTETGEGNHQDACLSRNKSIGYTDRLGTMYANFNALISGGAKGIYQFNMIGGRGTQEPWTDNLSRDPRQLEWLATYDRMLANAPKLANYKPTVYYRFPAQFNPCSMELYSEPCSDFYNMGGWWWREPIERSQNGLWILPSFSLRPETPMFIVNLEDRPASERFARELTDAIERGKRITVIGFRKDLGTIPAVDRYYTDRFAVNERGRKFQVLKATQTCRVVSRTKDGLVWNLIDGKLQVNSEEVFGKHGYSPENLVTGPEKAIDPYGGVFDLLGVRMLDLGPDLTGFTYKDRGAPVTVVSAARLTLPNAGDLRCTYPDGKPAGVQEGKGISVKLEPADRTLVRAKYDWGPDGILIDSLGSAETVIVRGWNGSRLALPSSDVLIEGERPKAHNFNYAWFGGIPTLSGNGFLGLETAVEPPADTGWYATYEFAAPKTGTYQLWLRENYLSFSSPCSYRIDSGDWIEAPNTFVPCETTVVALYNAVEDERQIFAWYHYGAVALSKGKHAITFRVDKPRPKGTVLTMADDRPYAKLIDCIVLVPSGGNAPGEAVTSLLRCLSPDPRPPLVNLLPNPSVEFDSDGDGKCDGWTSSEEEGMTWTKPGWGNVRVEGLVDLNLGLKEAYAEMRGLKTTAGERERTWSSSPIDVSGASRFLGGGWIRTSDAATKASFRIRWLDAAGAPASVSSIEPGEWSADWREAMASVAKPPGVESAVFECSVAAGPSGTAWFDDMVFAPLR